MTSYLEKAKSLKKLGLIDFPIPRKGKEHHLTPAQKTKITKLADKHKAIIKNPQDYVKRSVSKANSKKITSAVATIAKANKPKVAVWLHKAKNEKIKVLSGGRVRRLKGDYSITVYPGGWNIGKTADKLFAKKLVPREYITAQIGNNAPFSRTFTSKSELLNYLRGFQPKDKGVEKESLISHFALVRVRNDPDYVFERDMDEDEDEEEADY